MTARTAFGTLTLVFLASRAKATHPLTTDDAGTLGRGRVQIELVGEYERVRDAGGVAETPVAPTMPVLTVGVSPSVDLVAGVAYRRVTVDHDGERSTRSGMGDYAFDAKWRIVSRGRMSLALKPGLTLPTGDSDKGLGAGRATQHLMGIATWEGASWSGHANVGWTRNANLAGERESLWHASVAGVRSARGGFKLAVECGVDDDAVLGSRRWPVYVLGGAVYSASDGVDLDLGVKRRADAREASISVLAGVTIRL